MAALLPTTKRDDDGPESSNRALLFNHFLKSLKMRMSYVTLFELPGSY